ncbi:hypothetical protein [Tropicibacter sp. Alg240-R139]|uniref:hypothetical protein n=1 Tax=Tropicibacter sp. Alg240-R139 TaxID=2305991 RepID=UPI001966F6F1|nr:hypothetical protein [Tropicibacter sp. Alg240-R139]
MASQTPQIGRNTRTAAATGRALLQGPPRRKLGLLQRPQLISEVVGSAESNVLTLVIAGSGYGKSVLLSQVFDELTRHEMPCLWLTLNQDVSQTADLPDRLKVQLAALFQKMPQPTDDFVSLLRQFAENSEVTVFIDNWNFTENQDTNRYFELLLSETQGLARFVVSSRSMPSFQFEHLLLDNDARVLATTDLAFSRTKPTQWCRPM